MADFSKARVGTRIFNMFNPVTPDNHGQNDSIKDICRSRNFAYCTSGGMLFDAKGYRYEFPSMPMIFHRMPEFTDPEPPKRMVKKWLAGYKSECRGYQFFYQGGKTAEFDYPPIVGERIVGWIYPVAFVVKVEVPEEEA